MIMRQIELLTNKRHLLPKSKLTFLHCVWQIIWLCMTHNLWQLMIHNQFIGRLKRAHFGRIHKRNARRRNGMGSLKSDDRNRNRAEKDRKEKDRNKGERNHKVQSKYKKNHSKRRSLKVWTFWALIIIYKKCIHLSARYTLLDSYLTWSYL